MSPTLWFQVNLDTYDDVAKDYRFYEDPGDEFRNPPDGVSQKTNKHGIGLVFLKANLGFANQVIPF